MPISEKTKYIIFDFDETIATLILDWSGWFIGMEAIYRQYEPELRVADIEEYQNEFFEKFGTEAKRKVDQYSQEFENRNAKSAEAVENCVNFIKRVEGKDLFVWTNNYSGTAKKFLREMGIFEKFKLAVGREMVDFIKPHPDGFNKYFKDLGERQDFLFIGNSHFDRGAAENSGIEYLDVREI